MRKKIFAILLALCMVLTMMPSMAWAEGTDPEPVKLYAIYSGTVSQDGTTVTTSHWADLVDIPVDGAQGVKYLGYTAEDTSSEESEHTFTILDNPSGDYGDLVISEKNENGKYLLSFEGEISDDDKLEKVIPDKTATITTTPDGTSYVLNYRVTVPYLGAYKAPEINFTNLRMGEDLSYDDLAPVEGTDEEKAIYFIVNVEPGETVTEISLEGDHSDNISVEGNSTESTPAYLEVRVKDEILFEEIHVVAQIQTEGEDFSDNRYFRIHGNVMYNLGLEEESNPDISSTVTPEYIMNQVDVAPKERTKAILGIPAEEGTYQVVEITGHSPQLFCEQVEAQKGAYKIWANEDAESEDKATLGTTYYLYADVSMGETVKTYKIPVKYDFPMIGVYKNHEISYDSYIGCEDIYKKIVTDDNEQHSFFILSPDSNVTLSVPGGLPEGLTLVNVDENESASGLQYLEIRIEDNYIEGGFEVEAFRSTDNWNSNMGIGLAKPQDEEDNPQPGEPYVPADKNLMVCLDEGNEENPDYQPIQLELSEDGSMESAAQFFLSDHHDDRTFYVLSKVSGDLSLIELDDYRREGNILASNDVTIEYSGTTVYGEDEENEYNVWKVVVGNDFQGEKRVGFRFVGSGDAYQYQLDDHTPRMKFMWILDESYVEAGPPPEDLNEEIQLYNENPISGNMDEAGMECNDGVFRKILNMSAAADAESNAIYIVHPAGTTVGDNSYQAFAYQVDGSGFGRGNQMGGIFNQDLGDDVYTYSSLGSITVDNEAMSLTKATLNEFYGHNEIITDFYLVDSNDNQIPGYAEVYLQKGMNVVIKGAEEEEVVTIDDETNIVNQAVGIQPEPSLEFEQTGENTYTAFFDQACMQISDEGYGRWINFNVNLKPGYVVEKITDKSGADIAFYAERNFFYSPLDDNGDEIYDINAIQDLGWDAGVSGSMDDFGNNKFVIGAFHCIASDAADYGDDYRFESVNDECISDFVNFLVEGQHKATMKAAYTNYTVLFNPDLDDAVNEIVFHIKKADISDTENVAAIDKSIRCQIQPLTDAGIVKIEESLNALGYEGYEVLKAYDLSADENSDNGLYNITIPVSELAEGTNLEDYRVVYIDENNIPYEMETTYVDGEGIVFTTGHFSTYVVIYKPNETPTPTPDPTPTPGTPGGGLPASSTDKVTQSGDTTTADLSGSTTSKGGETTTTVDQTTADKMVETAVKNNSEEIVINAVTKNESAASSTKAAEVVLTGETLQTIAEKTDADVVVKTNVAEVKLDNKTAEAVASQTAEGETVSIIAEKVKEEAKEVQFELKIVTSSGKVISDFDGGNVAVTVNVPKSLQGKKLVCVYIDDNGYMHKVEGTLNADGTYTFNTGHFSTYALMDEGEAEAAIEAQKEAVKALKPTLRSSQVKTKSGKKAVKLTWKGGEDIQLDGIEIYRSRKKSNGYGKKPFYTTAKTSYLNTSVKAGKKYYYKVRGFVTIDGEKVYTQYSTKAWRTVK